MSKCDRRNFQCYTHLCLARGNVFLNDVMGFTDAPNLKICLSVKIATSTIRCLRVNSSKAASYRAVVLRLIRSTGDKTLGFEKIPRRRNCALLNSVSQAVTFRLLKLIYTTQASAIDNYSFPPLRRMNSTGGVLRSHRVTQASRGWKRQIPILPMGSYNGK